MKFTSTGKAGRWLPEEEPGSSENLQCPLYGRPTKEPFPGQQSDPGKGYGACLSQQSRLSFTRQAISSPSTRAMPPEHQQGLRSESLAGSVSWPSLPPRCPQMSLKVHCLASGLPANLEWPRVSFPADILMQALPSLLTWGKAGVPERIQGQRNTVKASACFHLFLLRNLRAVPKSLAIDAPGCHPSTEKQHKSWPFFQPGQSP